MSACLSVAPRARHAEPSIFAVLALAVPAALQLGCFAWTLAKRVAFPMDLEWMEGSQLYEAFRLAHGLPIYGPPGQGFIPSPYPPLYHFVVALLGRAFGFDYGIGRAVSDVSILAALAIQSAVIARAAPSRRLAAVLAVGGAAGVAAMYRPLQASMDLARVDAMGFALASLAAFLVRRPCGWGRSFAVGVTLCAAVYTKQTNVFYAAWIVLFVGMRDRRGAARIVVVASVLAGAALAALQAWTGGWFWSWMTIMRGQPLVPLRCAVTALMLAPAVASVALSMRALARRGWLGEQSRLWCGMLAAAIPACVLPTLTHGGWLNNLIGLSMLGWLAALVLLCDALRGWGGASAPLAHAAVVVLAAGLCGALYDPNSNVPDARRRGDVSAIHALVRGLDGGVLVPMYPFLAPRDGQTLPQISLLAYFDSGVPDADVARAVTSKRARWVLLLGHAEEHEVAGWLGSGYRAEALDMRVQALREETGDRATLLRRVEPP